MIVWPIKILTPRDMTVRQLHASTIGNPSLSGVSQVAASTAGRWGFSLENFPVAEASKIKLWRGIAARLQGRLGQISLPISDANRSVGLTDTISNPIPHSDTTFFGDATGYVQTVYPVIATADAIKGSVTISISYTGPTSPEVGQYFSLGVRLYIITEITVVIVQGATIKFWPPLREAISINQGLEFDFPNCLCRLATDNEMDLPLEMNLWANVKIGLVEDVGPVLP